jgi:NTE family protein
MSIPIIVTFNEYKDQILVDGSILSEDALLRDWAGDGTPAICFQLRSTGSGERYSKSHIPIVNYLTLLIRTFMTTMSREYVHDELWHNTVVVEIGNTSPITFSLSQQQKEDLYETGYRTTVEVVPMKVLFHGS